jgi:hypothetical protein
MTIEPLVKEYRGLRAPEALKRRATADFVAARVPRTRVLRGAPAWAVAVLLSIALALLALPKRADPPASPFSLSRLESPAHLSTGLYAPVLAAVTLSSVTAAGSELASVTARGRPWFPQAERSTSEDTP